MSESRSPGTPLETASWGRRILALAVDWFACILVVMLLLGFEGWRDDPRSGLYTLLLLVVESAVGTAVAGGSFGKLATRLRVVRVDDPSRPVDLLRALLRSAMVAVVIPPLVARPDGRGLHDMVAGTMTVTLADLKSR
ncbi:hypothetical protein DDE18_15135 [Nocardioides gansuensis]|uniref:RDD domain-containing protein n=1 Tax=Nocardioides gansuensis TaxID=2138300 RepID=A0A2T8F8J7_9ACTN|nr:RDD family protein [Nocardioides gansuensis]PVG82019.1 hypothetical protein DDE18_15135 [Nocardioides gansuensis]